MDPTFIFNNKIFSVFFQDGWSPNALGEKRAKNVCARRTQSRHFAAFLQAKAHFATEPLY